MGFNVQGRLHADFGAVQVTERFRKREFVVELEADTRYPQLCLFQLTGDRCDDLDSMKIGDEIKVEFRLRGRAWTPADGTETKYYNSLDVWAVELAYPERGDQTPPDEQEPTPGDDVPF